MKKQFRFKKIVNLAIFALVVSITFFISATVGLAWIGPTSPPPDGNPPGFIFNQFGTVNVQPTAAINIDGSITPGGGLCLPDAVAQPVSCKSTWQEISGAAGGGFWTQQGQYLYPNNNSWYVGIGNPAPTRPLSFTNAIGEKISLYSDSVNPGDYYGFGLESGKLIYQAPAAASHQWRQDATELMRLYNVAANNRGLYINGNVSLEPSGNYNLINVNALQSPPSGGLSIQSSQGAEDKPIYYGASEHNFYTNKEATPKLKIANNGNVGIGTANPKFKLSLDSDGGIFTQGTVGAGLNLGVIGAGERLIWYPKKSAFRAGSVDSLVPDAWDDGNIGTYSAVVGGTSNKASGLQSAVVGGQYNEALNIGSVIVGGQYNIITDFDSAIIGSSFSEIAANNAAILGGSYNDIGAGGVNAVILGGQRNIANGANSIAGGKYMKANADNVFIFGQAPAEAAANQNNSAIFYGVNVGVGTLAPAEKLEVAGNIKASGDICANNGTNCLGASGLWAAGGSNIYNTNTGNVGIGINDPEEKLEVGHRIRITDGSSNPELQLQYSELNSNDHWGIYVDRALNASLNFWSWNAGADGNRLIITQDGKVGINTFPQYRLLEMNREAGAPAQKWAAVSLQQAGSEKATFGLANASDEWFIGTAANDAVLRAEANNLWLGTYGANSLNFLTNNNERMTITADGKIGIGTTAPSNKLSVGDGSGANDGLMDLGKWTTLSGDSGGVGVFGLNFYNDGSFRTRYNHASLGYAGMIVQSNDNILFASNQGATTENAAITPTYRLIIKAADGNVGIGTTNPAQKLEVNGGIRLNTAEIKPTCDSSKRGTLWFTQGTAGAKDALEICAKDAADAYAWRALY